MLDNFLRHSDRLSFAVAPVAKKDIKELKEFQVMFFTLRIDF